MRCRFHKHGDTIAVQYGGSHLVNTMSTYRKTNQWSSQYNDLAESLKRYVNNSFLDKQRQEAYNLFLGNYIFAQGQPMLWDLSTDYYLHHIDPRAWFAQKRRSYRQWFTPANLSCHQLPVLTQARDSFAGNPPGSFDEWWNEYYRPHQLSQLSKLLPFKLQSAKDDESLEEGAEGKSPFRIKEEHGESSPGKQHWREAIRNSITTIDTMSTNSSQPSHQGHLSTKHDSCNGSILDMKGLTPIIEAAFQGQKPHKDKPVATQWTLDQFVTNSLNPSVTVKEAHEYQRYVDHPANLPLVVTNETPANANITFVDYVESVSANAVAHMYSTDDDLLDYWEFLDVGEEPLTVTDADTKKKRYKAYRQWVKGKSLFKQRVEA